MRRYFVTKRRRVIENGADMDEDSYFQNVETKDDLISAMKKWTSQKRQLPSSFGVDAAQVTKLRTIYSPNSIKGYKWQEIYFDVQ